MPESQQPEAGAALVAQAILSRPSCRVLDVGAGTGKWGKLLRGGVGHLIAVEVHAPHTATLRGLYDEVEHCNVLELSRTDFDTVILGDVLEHLEHYDALRLVPWLKEHASRIFLTIPVTVCLQDGAKLGNIHETHRYQWSDKELRALDFELFHVGTNPNGTVAIGAYQWLE